MGGACSRRGALAGAALTDENASSHEGVASGRVAAATTGGAPAPIARAHSHRESERHGLR